MMAINAPPKQMAEAAAYFESRGQEDRAVGLYQKAGQTAKAVELCFRCRLFDQLREIAEHLPSDADPALFKSCAEFFLDHGQYEKTVRLFAKSGEYSKALDLCVMHSLPLSEELAEQMCPQKTEILGEMSTDANSILLKVANVLKRQGNYHLASQKYTQAGDKVKAMKCLLKSADTQKVRHRWPRPTDDLWVSYWVSSHPCCPPCSLHRLRLLAHPEVIVDPQPARSADLLLRGRVAQQGHLHPRGQLPAEPRLEGGPRHRQEYRYARDQLNLCSLDSPDGPCCAHSCRV